MHARPVQVVEPEIVGASVHTAGTRMAYRRGGSGRAVLLARSSAADPAEHARWLRLLAGRFRVFATDQLMNQGDGGDQPRALRLRRFLDGLGLERAAVVADPSSAAELLGLTLAEPDRVERIVIVLPVHSDPKCQAWLPPGRIERSPLVLLMRLAVPGAAAPTLPAEAAMDRMLSFLAGDG
jgi:pimeloyl-ACP methyl ester carboxylesterase